jgi:hypothetical protein
MNFQKDVFMRKLGLIKVLGVFSVFYSSSISFADPGPLVEGFEAVSSLMGKVDQAHVDVFKKKIQGIVNGLESELQGGYRNGDGKIRLGIAYLKGLIEIVDKIWEYQQNPSQQLRGELEAIARTYGGEVRELIWSLLHPPAPAPALPPPVPAAAAL